MARFHIFDLRKTSKKFRGFLFALGELHVLRSGEHLSLVIGGAKLTSWATSEPVCFPVLVMSAVTVAITS